MVSNLTKRDMGEDEGREQLLLLYFGIHLCKIYKNNDIELMSVSFVQRRALSGLASYSAFGLDLRILKPAHF